MSKMVYKVDNSRLKGVAQCSTYAVLRYCLGLSSVAESAPRFCGQVFHEALAAYFSGEDPAVVQNLFEEKYRPFADANIMADDRLSYSNVSDILAKYVKTPIDFYPFVPIKEGIEKTVSGYLDQEKKVLLYCKLDLPAREKSTKSLCFVDHKTTGQINSRWAKQFRMCSQITGYLWALEKEYKEVVPNAYINAIQINKLPESSRKCRVHKVPYYECREEHTKFELFVTERTPKDIEKWRHDALRLAKKLQILEKSFPTIEHVQFAPMEGRFNQSCDFCEFVDFCFYGRKPETASSLLVEDPWLPWEEETEKREKKKKKKPGNIQTIKDSWSPWEEETERKEKKKDE